MKQTYVVGEAGALGISTEGVTAFLREEWKRLLCLARPDFYTWQFKNVPQTHQVDRSVVIADEDGGIHGFLGVNARPFWLDGQVCEGAELTTWKVSEHLQGKGYAPKMLQFLMEQHEVMIGARLLSASLAVFTRLGWRYIRALPRFVRVLNPDRIASVSEVTPLGKS